MRALGPYADRARFGRSRKRGRIRRGRLLGRGGAGVARPRRVLALVVL